MSYNLENFDWGQSNQWFRETIHKEIFKEKIYEKFFEVEENDIVFDAGASIGPFSYTIKNKKPKHIFCVEPSEEQIKTLKGNIIDTNHTIIPCAIGDGNTFVSEIFGEGEKYKTKTKNFAEIISEYNIDKIDFLKTDCEGGEYNIFNIDNLCWLKENLRKCSGEWHLSTEETKIKFREFRDVFLRVFPNHEIYSVDGTNIKWDLWNEHFIEYYKQIIVYIDNR